MAKSDQAVIFLNGELKDSPYLRRQINEDALVIGCDGGTKHLLALGYMPAAVIGDFDSYAPGSDPIEDTAYIHYPADKDVTDAELAIRYAVKSGCREIILAGALGGRLDHLLANVWLLNKFESPKLHLRLIDGDQEAYVIAGRGRIRGKKGDSVSIMPLSGNPVARDNGGLKYRLAGYRLSRRGNTGVSNVLLRASVDITVDRGVLLVVHQR